MGKKKIPVPW
jgi:hypothetical protein